MPVIYDGQASARALYLSEDYIKKFPNKNPDIMYNNKPADIKCVSNSMSSIQAGIRKGKKQANLVILRLPEDTQMEEAVMWASGRLKLYEGEEKLTVWLIKTDQFIELTNK